MNLIPSQNFTIIRQLANVTDTNTYYVQAVVRNIITGKTIATIKLTNQGNQRFTAPYQIPADTSGQGTYISICTYVFDDAGYSVPDGNYSTEDKEYLIIQPPVSTYGNGGSTIVDYDRIKKDILDGIKFPGIPTYDKNFKSLQKINEDRFGEVKEHIEKTVKAIDFPRYDDTEVKNSISALKNELMAERENHAKQISLMMQSHSKAISDLKTHHEEIKKTMEERLSKIADRPYAAERDRDSLAIEHENLRRDYESVVGAIGMIKATGKYEAPEDAIQKRVKKLLGQ